MSVELQIRPDGSIRSIYKDELQPVFEKLGTQEIQRASNVEWEKGTGDLNTGWTVRAAHDTELAIRVSCTRGAMRRIVSKSGELLYFNTREAALEAEQEHFWELLPP